jgi:hypothetical protein
MLRILLALLVAAAAADAKAKCNQELLSVDDWAARQVNERNIEVTVSVRSHSKKPIRMIEAIVGFTDALGADIGAIILERDVNVAAGERFVDKGLWTPQRFGRLLKVRKQDVKTDTCVTAVLYEDGSKETF